MHSRHYGFILLVAGLAAGFVMGAGLMDRDANAQGLGEDAAASSRFQVSAWTTSASQYDRQRTEGCYVVDTATGELWRYEVRKNQLKQVSKGLR